MVDARADDAQLVEAAQAGDRDAFAAIFDRYAPRVHAFCTRLLNEPHTASDATQDTFVAAAQRLDQLRDPSALRAWLYAIARNECTRHGRARARAVPTEDAVMAGQTGDDLGADEPARAAAADETGAILWDAAAGLDEGDRILLELHVRHGLEGAELAEAAGVAPGQISMATGRMRERVARSVGALLIARKGRADCPGLQVVLADWDGSYDVLTRKRVARHIDSCELCDERRAALVAPFGALAVGPALVAFQLPDGALVGVRDTVLAAFDRHVAGAGGGGEGGADGATGAADAVDPDPAGHRKRRALVALAVLAIVALVAIVSVAGGNGGDSQAVRSEDGPSISAEDGDASTTVADVETTTTKGTPEATTTSTPAVTTPNGAPITTVPGEVANPGNPSEGPQATVPPSIAGPPVTLVPGTVPPTAPNQPPSVGATSRSPAGSSMQTTCNPASDTRTISVGAADDRGVTQVVLRWTQSGGGTGQRTMTRSGSTWTAPLGPFADPGTVTYRAVATDTNGASAASPSASIGVDPCPG
ncbi:sigma-70 family RNA polymerase sigma factor [Aquihabitans daechungensis]|uniref:sigma-70 family RNA polymerase sigma factor n=1 Tax=Aquihabitans daechungensis TaxID=1052257 RepID=UPI003BA37D07